MADLARSVASLRVSGEELLPDEVSSLLGAAPSWAYARGDQVSTRGPIRLAKHGMWLLQAAETVPADLDAQVDELLGHLTPDLGTWHELADRFSVDLFCGWFMSRPNEGLEVSPRTLLALGERQVVLGLDIYGGDDEDAR
jgi:hypothetical protein